MSMCFRLSSPSPTSDLTLFSARANCFKSQMGRSSGYVESSPPPLPGLISCVVDDDSFTPTPTQRPSSAFLAAPFILFSCTVPLSCETAWKGQIFYFFLHPSFPFLILRGSVLAHTDDAELWAATHITVQRRSRSQTLPGFLLKRSVTGEYGRMGFISLDFKKSIQRVKELFFVQCWNSQQFQCKSCWLYKKVKTSTKSTQVCSWLFGRFKKKKRSDWLWFSN